MPMSRPHEQEDKALPHLIEVRTPYHMHFGDQTISETSKPNAY